MDAKVFDAVHDYWFGPLGGFDSFPQDRFGLWFGGGEAVDRDIAERFGSALEAVAAGIAPEPAQPSQEVGRIVLLDQMSRNVHRNSADAFALDPVAQSHARTAIAGGLARFKLVERVFVILPLGHSENLADQDMALDLFRTEVAPHAPEGNRFYEASRIQSQKYRDIIARFGRFPHRNVLLGRTNTAEEDAFLAEAKMTPF